MPSVKEPTQQLSTDPTAAEIVSSLLSSAARTGELGIAWARLCGGFLVTLAWPLVHGGNLLQLVPRAWATLLLGILALGWSLFVILKLRRSTPTVALTYVSITVDAILFNAMLLMFVLWPSVIHQSVVEVHGTAFVYLAIVTAGIRLSTTAAYFGAALNSLLLIGLVILSSVLVSDLQVIGPAEWTTVAIGLIGATVLGVNIASRTSTLVEQSAQETLLAAKARARLGAYVSPEIADVVLKENELRLGGKRQSVAVLFSDLRGFTSYAETLEPEQIVEQLNQYMSVMVETIAKHGGVVDKFMGDGIMAVFGAPVSHEDDADRAVECAQAMMASIDRHNESREQRNLPRLKHGIGVHFGPVIAGNVGTASRAAYTVIGDTVNLASRLEQMTKKLEADLIVSLETVNACTRSHPLREVDEIRVPGREQSVVVYEVS